jgi:hypothetical protein
MLDAFVCQMDANRIRDMCTQLSALCARRQTHDVAHTTSTHCRVTPNILLLPLPMIRTPTIVFVYLFSYLCIGFVIFRHLQAQQLPTNLRANIINDIISTTSEKSIFIYTPFTRHRKKGAQSISCEQY